MTLPLVDRFANSGVGFGARATLASDPGASGTTLTLTTGHGARFPTVVTGDRLMLNIDDELLTVTAHTASADTMTVVRGAEGTTGATHAAGSTVATVVTATQMQTWQPDGLPYQPRYNSLLAASGDPHMFSDQNETDAGSIRLAKLYLPEVVTLSNIVLNVSVGGSGLTAGLNYGLVYNSAGTLLGRTADQTSTGWTSSGVKTLALTVEGGQSLTLGGPGVYVLAGPMSTGTTRPFFKCIIKEDAININLSGLGMRAANYGFNMVAVPNPLSGGSMNSVGKLVWVGLS